MNFFTLIVLFFSMSLHAHNDCDQNPFPELKEILELKQAIEWQAAPDQILNEAYCLRKDPFTDKEMKDWINSQPHSIPITETVNGIRFENETPENINTFKLLTSPLTYHGELIPEKKNTYKSNCKKVDCALKQIFGATSTQLQYMHQKFGLNGSHISYEDASPWKKDELDISILAMADYPSGLLPLTKTKMFIHGTRGSGNGRVLANATITVFDAWDTKSKEYQRSTIFHELAHFYAGRSDMDEGQAWMSKSGWQRTTKIVDGKKVTHSEAEFAYTIVSEYGQKNEAEDFAESAVAYRYNPRQLKEVDPEKFEFLKKYMFDNVEYTSEQSCQGPTRSSDNFARRGSVLAEQWVATPNHLQAISKACSQTAIERLSDRGTINLSAPEFRQCYEKEIRNFAKTFVRSQYRNDPNKEYLDVMVRNKEVQLTPAKMGQLISQVMDHHATTLRGVLTQASNGQFSCTDTLAQYSYQNYDEALLGMNTLNNKEQLNRVNAIMCTTLKSHSKPATVQGMIQK